MDTAPKVTLTSGVSKEEEDDNMIMLLLSNDSASSAAVADLLHSSLITMVESCTSCTRNGKTIWRVVKHLCLRAGADPLWYS